MKNFFKFIQDAVENVKEEAGKALENAQDLSQDLTATFQKQMEEAQKQMEEVQRQIMEAQANAQNPSAENENNGGLGNMLQGFLGSLEGFGGENSTQQESKNETKVFKQIFKDLNEGEIIKFQTPDGKFIVSKNHFHCQGDYSSGSIETHYDIVNNALQILDITYNEGKVTEVSHKVCEFSNIEITDSGWNYPRLHTDMLGVVVVYTKESVPRYTYKIDSKEVERVCYSSSYDIGLSTDKDPRNSFKIVEELILPNISAEMQAFYHSSIAQTKREEQIATKMAEINAAKAEKESEERYAAIQLAQKNREFAEMQALSLKPLEGIKESIAKNGLPKEKSFVTKKGETIYFDGELIFWQPTQNGLYGRATYFEIKNENDKKYIHLINVEYDEEGEILYVAAQKALAEYVICKPHNQDYANFYFDEQAQSYRFVLFADWGVTAKYCYSQKSDSTDNQYTDESDTLFFHLHSLEDIYALAGRIFFALNEYNQPNYANFLSEVIAGTFVKFDLRSNEQDNSDEEESSSYVSNSNSSSSSSSSKKEEKKEEKPTNSSSSKKELFDIKIKNDQKDGSVTIYNQNRGGSYNIQRGVTTTIKCYAGDKLFDYEGHKKGRLLFVVEESMDGKVQLFTKL
jgi:hypothetical protein